MPGRGKLTGANQGRWPLGKQGRCVRHFSSTGEGLPQALPPGVMVKLCAQMAELLALPVCPYMLEAGTEKQYSGSQGLGY